MRNLFRTFLFLGFLSVTIPALCQSYMFAQLQGSPVNTSGWNLTGSAKVGDILFGNHSEVLLCDNMQGESGSIFYNRQLDLSQCNKWRVEFDFRIFDGTSGDGLAFCFLEVPPSNFVSGMGVGIPDNTDGLKVVFDTYRNCTPPNNPTAEVPKIELRWGPYYTECAAFQPTLTNTNGSLDFIRSSTYNHAEIIYDAGNISVSLNGNLYLTGYQQINLKGYLGFTSGTGVNYDNHSIKNVTIYTNTPSVVAGNDVTICTGETINIGSPANPLYTYQWTPSADINSTTDAQPLLNGSIPTGVPERQTKYFVTASLNDIPGCIATDSITVTVRNTTSLSLSSSTPSICEGNSPPTFTAIPFATGKPVQYEWSINNIPTNTTDSIFRPESYANGDKIEVRLKNTGVCPNGTDVLSEITIPVYPLPIVNAGPSVNIFYGSSATLYASVEGNVQNFSWSPAIGLNNVHSITPLSKPAATILYTITAVTDKGCVASDTVTVKVSYHGISIPTSFTPNNDGLNDVFKPLVPPDLSLYQFVVYSRWGQTLFTSRNPGEGWDGSNKGIPLQNSAYIWKLTCRTAANALVEKSGTVILIR